MINYSMISRFGRGGLIAAALAGSLLFGNAARADDIVNVHSKISLSQKYLQLQGLVDKVTLPTETLMKKQMIETAIHESGNLKYSRRLKDGKELGLDRSIFMIQPNAAKDMVSWAKYNKRARELLTKASGKTFKQLSSMSKDQLADLVQGSDLYAAATSRVKYMSVSKAGGPIPQDIASRATYWSKYYQGTSNPTKTQQYVQDNYRMTAEMSAAGKVPTPPKNYGVGIRAHDHKIKHNVKSQKSKLSVMQKVLKPVR